MKLNTPKENAKTSLNCRNSSQHKQKPLYTFNYSKKTMKKLILLLIFLLIPLASAFEYDTDSVDDSWTTITFDQAFSVRPLVFTQVTSDNEADLTVTRLRGITTTGFEVRLQESPVYYDSTHVSEDLAWLALEPNEVGESRGFGLRQNNPSAWRNKNFFTSFSDTPYFFSQVQSNRNWQPVHADIRNITYTDFFIKLEEPGFNNIHPKEIVGVLAFEDFADAEYDVVSVDSNWVSVSFSETYTEVPSVLASVNSENEDGMVVVSVKDVTTTGFEIKLSEFPDDDGTHVSEDVSYIVLGEVVESLNVAIVDTGSSGISYIESALQGEGHSTTLMSFNEVISDLDSSYDVLVYPGGQTGVDAVLYNQYPGMIDAIQDFVNVGGDYIGICGGAIVGSNGFVYNGLDVTEYTYQLDLLDVEATWYTDWSYYVGNMVNLNFSVDLIHDAINNYITGPSVFLDYAGGPTFTGGTADILLSYVNDIDGNGGAGDGALSVGSYGAGRVVLSAIHPEYNDEELLVNYLDWVSL